MPSNVKKYVISAVTLGCIGAVAALAIAGTNLLTKKRIEDNLNKTKNEALNVIFENAKFSEKKEDISVTNASYIKCYYVAYDTKDAELGYVYSVGGRNAYGEIEMMVGITSEGVGKFSVITNTQSFASTLEDNYIVPIQNGEKTFNDISCGATYGATLMKNMVKEASTDYALKKGQDVPTDEPEEPVEKNPNAELDEVFAGALFSDKKTDVSVANAQYIKGYYVAYDKNDNELGYVYSVSGTNRYGTVEMYVGVTSEGVGNFKVTKNTESYASDLEDGYIIPIQNGEKTFEDVNCGATFGATLIRDMVKEASADYAMKKGGN